MYLFRFLWLVSFCSIATTAISVREWKSFQKVFLDMPDETMIIDADMKIRAVSKKYASHIKPPVTPEAIVGTSFVGFVNGRVSNEKSYLQAVQTVFETGDKTLIHTNDILGSQYEMENVPVRDAKGRIYAVKHQIKHVISHTSTEYLHLLQTESEKNAWKPLVNSLSDYAIFVVCKNFIIQTWSEQCEKVYGWSEQDVLGKHYSMLMSHEQLLTHPKSPVINTEERIHTVSHKRKSGSSFLVEEKTFPIYSHNVHVGNSVINKDLTALSQSQSMLLEAREQAQKQQNNFLSSISHESRSNTAIIVSSVETMLDPKNGFLNAYQRETCEDIYQASRLLLQVVDDILDHASFTKVGIHLKTDEFSLHKVVLGVMKVQERSLYQTKDKNKNLDLTCFIDPKIPSNLYGDDIRISQIITNLVSNAIKFTDTGSVHLRVENGVSVYPDKTNLMISVEDTGVGISETQQPLLFSPFYQADAGLSRKQTGTGLGLSNVKMLVETMSGIVSVSSVPGKGSTFRCQIHVLNKLLSSGNEETSKSKRKPFGRQRSYSVPERFLDAPILLVEDNMILAKFAQRALSTLGFSNVIWIDNGLKAIAEARNTPKDLILMDLSIPGLNGIEASRQIRHFDSRVAIVALTANALQQDKIMCMEAGMDAHLSKPVSTKELKDTIVDHLHRISCEDANRYIISHAN